MFWVLLLCIISLAILFLVRAFCIKSISKTDSAKKAVRIRKTFRIFRIILIIVFTFILIILTIAIIGTSIESNVQHSPWLRFRMIFCLIVIVAITYSAMSLPVSSTTLKNFNKKKLRTGYALFLRGFSSDSYVSTMQERAVNLDTAYQRSMNFSKKADGPQNVQSLPFSEKDFYSSLKKRIPIYCVGMTKELESPEGINRIYLEESTWKEDVIKLIEGAKYVFILVNDSDNCIWEINKCLEIAKDKTIFIVDNGIVIANMWLKLGDNIPEGLCLGMPNHSIVFRTKKGFKTIRYTNNAAGFKSVINTIMS